MGTSVGSPAQPTELMFSIISDVVYIFSSLCARPQYACR